MKCTILERIFPYSVFETVPLLRQVFCKTEKVTKLSKIFCLVNRNAV